MFILVDISFSHEKPVYVQIEMDGLVVISAYKVVRTKGSSIRWAWAVNKYWKLSLK